MHLYNAKPQEGAMKKYLSFILCLAVVISLMMFFPTHSLAADDQIVLPEYKCPALAYPTFAETGIPYDQLISILPEKLDIKYKDGILYVQDLGDSETNITLYLQSDSLEGELVDGYWQFTVSSEEYNNGAGLSMHTPNRSWHAEYDISGKRKIVSFTTYFDKYSRIVVLYPEAGYGKQFVQVVYDLIEGLRVTDIYSEGFLYEQTVELHTDSSSLWGRYDANGNIQYFNVSINKTGDYASYIPGKGWSENSWEYTPVDAPVGYEDATLESLLSTVPTNIGCAHQWEGPLCDAPAICSLCHAEKGDPISHSWVSGTDYDTCSTCNGILYKAPDIAMPSFEGRPFLNLESTGVNADAIISKLPKKILTKYENGVFMVPNIDGYDFDADLDAMTYVSHKTLNGWNIFEVLEEDLDELELEFSKTEEQGDLKIWFNLEFDADGNLLSFNLYEDESNKSLNISLEENTVELSYPKENTKHVEYTDVYRNGEIISQEVYDMEKYLHVYYDSDLNIEKVEIWKMGRYYTFIPGKGWTNDESETISAPEGYEDKDAAFFAETYPHCITFCIHSFELSEDGNYKTCVKCQETVQIEEKTESNDSNITANSTDTNDDVVIIIVVVSVVLLAAFAAIVIVVVKKKKANAE